MTHPLSTKRVARLLLLLLEDFYRTPDAADMIDEVTFAAREGWRTVDRAPDRRPLGKCFAEINGQLCQADLTHIAGAETTRCSVCGTTWSVPDKRAWLLELSRDTLVTRSEGIAGLGMYGLKSVDATTIGRWRDRGRISVRGHNIEGHEQFRMGDLIELHIEALTGT